MCIRDSLPDGPVPPLLVQVGRYDTRADPRHGRRLAERLGGVADVRLSEYAVGHVERFAAAESRRAVEEATEFVRGRLRDAAGPRTAPGTRVSGG